MKKTLITLNRLRTTAIAVAIIVVAVMIFWLVRVSKNNEITITADNRIDITPEQIQSIKAIGEWEFLSITDEDMVDTTRSRLFGNDRLVRIYYGTMRLGINMHHTKPGWIKPSGDSVSVTLPPVELLDHDFIDEARTRSFHESGRWTAEDREAMYRRAHRMMKARGLTPANINTARNNADAQMRSMLRAIGFRHITIRFENRAPLLPPSAQHRLP